ncbi:uncharacterized protein LOC110854477 isoform X2 [Folsomia candida]|uniref:uncharacterized protein LOC110854477 isoform X2 n=1 Tax=Folsomia candida TaxID=158441 RepID=UPI000B900E8F|nr:uncharacterized protein LOC110854477 isoform X2 [Folsomia candida]
MEGILAERRRENLWRRADNQRHLNALQDQLKVLNDLMVLSEEEDKLRSDVLADIRDTKILLGIEPAPPIPIEDPESDNSQRRPREQLYPPPYRELPSAREGTTVQNIALKLGASALVGSMVGSAVGSRWGEVGAGLGAGVGGLVGTTGFAIFLACKKVACQPPPETTGSSV